MPEPTWYRCADCRHFKRDLDFSNWHAPEAPRRLSTGLCRAAPPVRLPREFAPGATAEARQRVETVRWGWPAVKDTDSCGHWTPERVTEVAKNNSAIWFFLIIWLFSVFVGFVWILWQHWTR